MAVHQGEVYLLPHPITPNSSEPHPFIVLSTFEANKNERTFICVMVTSSQNTKDDYSFDLTNDMFEHSLDKEGCHVRMHLLTLMINEEIIGRRLNKMRPFYFNQLMKTIGELVFDYNFTPIESES